MYYIFSYIVVQVEFTLISVLLRLFNRTLGCQFLNSLNKPCSVALQVFKSLLDYS